MNTRNIRFASNRLCDVRSQFLHELLPLYSKGEVDAFFAMLCEEYLGLDWAHVLLHLSEPINQSDLLRFHWALEELLQERPIQHVIGHVDFCQCRIEVNASVLIPRPETEEIVQRLSRLGRPMKSILDLCTGSGCIAIALKRAFPQAQVTAVDLSPEALAVACRNAAKNGADVRFLQEDVLGGLPGLAESYDLVVSNPPYVLDSERATMRRNVLEYDPSLALFVPDSDPLLFYRAIGRFAQGHLAPGGVLALEMNALLAGETEALLQSQGFSTESCDDFRGMPRLLLARTT